MNWTRLYWVQGRRPEYISENNNMKQGEIEESQVKCEIHKWMTNIGKCWSLEFPEIRNFRVSGNQINKWIKILWKLTGVPGCVEHSESILEATFVQRHVVEVMWVIEHTTLDWFVADGYPFCPLHPFSPFCPYLPWAIVCGSTWLEDTENR